MDRKICARCNLRKPLTEEHWYKARPTSSHPKGGWQSNCRECWKFVNRQNKERRKNALRVFEMSENRGAAG